MEPGFSITDAADILGISRQSVWRAIRRAERGGVGLHATSRTDWQGGFWERLWIIHPADLAEYQRRTLVTTRKRPKPAG